MTREKRTKEEIESQKHAAKVVGYSHGNFYRAYTSAFATRINMLSNYKWIKKKIEDSKDEEKNKCLKILLKVLDNSDVSLGEKYKLIVSQLKNSSKIIFTPEVAVNIDWGQALEEKKHEKPGCLTPQEWDDLTNPNLNSYEKKNSYYKQQLEGIFHYYAQLRILALRKDAFAYVQHREGTKEKKVLNLARNLLHVALDEFNVLLRERLDHEHKGEEVPENLTKELARKKAEIDLICDERGNIYKKYVKPHMSEDTSHHTYTIKWTKLKNYADDLRNIYHGIPIVKKESLTSPVNLTNIIVTRLKSQKGIQDVFKIEGKQPLDPYSQNETQPIPSSENDQDFEDRVCYYRSVARRSHKKDVFSRMGAVLLSDNDSYQDLFKDLGLDSEVIEQQVTALRDSIKSGISRLEVLDFMPEYKAEFLVDEHKTYGSNRSDSVVDEKSLSEVSIYERTQRLIEQIATQVYSLDMGKFPETIPLLSFATQEALRTGDNECKNELKKELVKRIYTQLIQQAVLSLTSSDEEVSDTAVIQQEVSKKLLALNIDDVVKPETRRTLHEGKGPLTHTQNLLEKDVPYADTKIIVQDVKPCKDERELLLKLVRIYEDYKAQGGKNKVYNLAELKDVIGRSELATKILNLNLFPYVDCSESSSYIDLKKKNKQYCEDKLKLKKYQWKSLYLGRSGIKTLNELAEAPPRLADVTEKIHSMISSRSKEFSDRENDIRRVRAFFHFLDKEEVENVKAIQTELMGIVNTQHRVSFTIFGAGKAKIYALKALDVLNEIQRTLGMEQCNPHCVQKLRDYAQKNRHKRIHHKIPIGKHHDQRAQALLNVLADCDVSVDIKLIIIEDQIFKMSGGSSNLMENTEIQKLMINTNQNTSFIENVTRLDSHPGSQKDYGTFNDCLAACKKYYLSLKKQPPLTYDEPAPSGPEPVL